MSVAGGVWLSLHELSMSLYELSLSLPELSFKGSSVSGAKDVFELIEYQLVQLVEIQGESLVQGEFLVIPLVLLSKGERFMHIHCQICKVEVADLRKILEIRVVANCGCQCMVIRVVANNSKGGDCCS